jgi:single-stranded DNA-binding protein
MADFNRITVLGTIIAEPVKEQTKNGLDVLSFVLENKNEKSGGRPDEINVFNVSVYGNQVDKFSPFIMKDERVLVEGRLTLAKDIKIIASTVVSLR